MVKECDKAAPVIIDTPVHMTIYKPDSAYQKICLCDYLRELPEDPVDYTAGRDSADPQVSCNKHPVGH